MTEPFDLDIGMGNLCVDIEKKPKRRISIEEECPFDSLTKRMCTMSVSDQNNQTDKERKIHLNKVRLVKLRTKQSEQAKNKSMCIETTTRLFTVHSPLWVIITFLESRDVAKMVRLTCKTSSICLTTKDLCKLPRSRLLWTPCFMKMINFTTHDGRRKQRKWYRRSWRDTCDLVIP